MLKRCGMHCGGDRKRRPGSAARLALGAGMVAALLLGAAPATPPSRPAPLRKITPLLERDGLRPGESMRVVLKVSLAREFHVNSHIPSQEYLIPTSVEAISLDGLKAAEWSYPEGELKRFAFSEEPIRIYEGDFRIAGEIAAPADAAPSDKALRFTLRYQACTRDRCYPPAKEPVEIAVRVVSLQEKTSPLHPDIFPKPPSKP